MELSFLLYVILFLATFRTISLLLFCMFYSYVPLTVLYGLVVF